jgi:predicted transcriptional regulator
MPVTSLKLPERLKRRLAAVVAGTDQSAHGFMVEAIAREVEAAERRHAFLRQARAAERQALRSGKAYDAGEVFDYLEERARGKTARRPRPRAWRRSA